MSSQASATISHQTWFRAQPWRELQTLLDAGPAVHGWDEDQWPAHPLSA
ncbi:MAG: hypothetical protein ACLPQY_07070 [Streptosporangiaceae bacterium]